MATDTSMAALAVRLLRETAVLGEALNDISWRLGMLSVAVSVERPGSDAAIEYLRHAEHILAGLPAVLEYVVTDVIARPDLGPMPAPVAEDSESGTP